ncbi:MAG: hypothetical protein QXK37_01540 [Candidatus Woesearchaeota archaeon]
MPLTKPGTKSPAVEYAIKEYKGKGRLRKADASLEKKSSDTVEQNNISIDVVRIKKRPLRRALDKIKRYFK